MQCFSPGIVFRNHGTTCSIDRVCCCVSSWIIAVWVTRWISTLCSACHERKSVNCDRWFVLVTAREESPLMVGSSPDEKTRTWRFERRLLEGARDTPTELTTCRRRIILYRCSILNLTLKSMRSSGPVLCGPLVGVDVRLEQPVSW